VTAPGIHKETLGSQPELGAVEIKEPQPGQEVKGWLEKLEKGEAVNLPQPVVDDFGQVLVQSAAPQKPKIVLPLDDKSLVFGLTQNVFTSIRWLTQWCLRLIKMNSKNGSNN